MTTRQRYRLFAAVATVIAVIAALGVTARAAAGAGDRVTVLASWTGAEAAGFQQVLRRFTELHGIEVEYQGTRALEQVLLAAVRDGTPPDVAVLPNPGALAGYARRGALHPLDELPGLGRADRDDPRWLRLETGGQAALYAVAIKADLKSLIWYRPGQLESEPPQTWEQLVAVAEEIRDAGTTPWCLGMGSTPTSGWPGTDWLENILLHQSGAEVYQRWSAGTLPWTSPEVTEAWQSWASISATPGMTHGGAAAALLTDFADAGRPLFTDPPGCLLDHQASFAMGAYEGYEQRPQRGVDFDFFAFPAFGEAASSDSTAVVVAADLAGMFQDTEPARALIEFLASEQAQRVWADAGPGSVFTLGSDGSADYHQDELSRRIAQTLDTAEALCFDGSDLMPATMTNAFHHAVMEFLHAPDQLDQILRNLESIRQSIDEEEWLTLPCGG